MPDYDGTILSILAVVVGALLAERFWERRQDAKEKKERVGADIALVKAIIKINNSLQQIKSTVARLQQEINGLKATVTNQHRVILGAVTKLTQNTIERERQRRCDD